MRDRGFVTLVDQPITRAFLRDWQKRGLLLWRGLVKYFQIRFHIRTKDEWRKRLSLFGLSREQTLPLFDRALYAIIFKPTKCWRVVFVGWDLQYRGWRVVLIINFNGWLLDVKFNLFGSILLLRLRDRGETLCALDTAFGISGSLAAYEILAVYEIRSFKVDFEGLHPESHPFICPLLLISEFINFGRILLSQIVFSFREVSFALNRVPGLPNSKSEVVLPVLLGFYRARLNIIDARG